MSQLNDQTEQQLYNGFTAESADELQSQFERQVYNAYTAAGGGGGGGGGPSPATTKPLADAGTGAVGTSLAYARADHQHPSSGGGTGELPELTEEHVVGYLNGKPVYKKIIITTSPNTNATPTNIFDIASLNIHKLMSFDGTVLRAQNLSSIVPINWSRDKGAEYISTWMYYTNLRCEVVSTDLLGKQMTITLIYTKTTD